MERKRYPKSSRGGWRATSVGRWLVVTLAVWGSMLALLVGADGLPLWRIVRVVVVVAVTAAALWIAARKPRLGAIAAIILGTIGLIVGIVFGFHYLMVDGLSWRAVVGLIDFVTGIWLLILGGKQLLTGIGRGWKLIDVPALVIFAAVATWVFTPAVLATNVPPVPNGPSIPRDFGLTAQEVHFTTADGVELGGWYIPSTNQSAVVLRHGSGSTGADTLPQAAVLAKHGYGVLVTDARGHGLSGGRAMDFGWNGNEDTIAAVSFLAAQSEINAKKIAVVGMSMGGEEAHRSSG